MILNRISGRICMILFLMTALNGFGQWNPSRIELGGNFGFQFGSTTALEISPSAGYWFTDYLLAGTGLTYLYVKESGNGAVSSSIYGGNLFAKVFPVQEAFVQAEYQIMNTGYTSVSGSRRDWVQGLLAGGGYQQAVGGNTFLTLTVLWELLQEPGYPYNNPVIRAGITTRL